MPIAPSAPPPNPRGSDGLPTTSRKYPQFQQQDIFGLQDAFRKLDVDDKGYIDEATVIKATQQSERQPYDVVRQALKEVDLDSSRRVELDDYVDVRSRVLFESQQRVFLTKIWLHSSSLKFGDRHKRRVA